MRKKLKGVKETISTADGEKRYIGTETEDKNENWGQEQYSIKNGYWVIHQGEQHHIYK